MSHAGNPRPCRELAAVLAERGLPPLAEVFRPTARLGARCMADLESATPVELNPLLLFWRQGRVFLCLSTAHRGFLLKAQLSSDLGTVRVWQPKDKALPRKAIFDVHDVFEMAFDARDDNNTRRRRVWPDPSELCSVLIRIRVK